MLKKACVNPVSSSPSDAMMALAYAGRVAAVGRRVLAVVVRLGPARDGADAGVVAHALVEREEFEAHVGVAALCVEGRIDCAAELCWAVIAGDRGWGIALLQLEGEDVSRETAKMYEEPYRWNRL